MSAARKWSVARELHEKWNVPHELLDRVLGRAAGACQRKAGEDGWAASGPASAAPLHRQLVVLFEGQLSGFDADEQSRDVEKRARALQMLAKTLESIAAVGAKLAELSGEVNNTQNGRANDPNSPAEPGRIQDLDDQLAKLVDNLASSEPAG